VFEAVFDVVIIETVGVGQSETEIEEVVDTVVFVVQPGSGDALQFMKAGIMEIPHIMVINKADQKLIAEKALNDLKAVCSLRINYNSEWRPDIVMTSALLGWGQEQLVSSIEKHFLHMSCHDINLIRRQHRINWIFLLFKERFGSFGIETLGGEEKVFSLIKRNDIVNPFDGLKQLTEMLWKTTNNIL
jgi:LAO/AO transport system kinase